jgi:tetratricopeptide (TPR) repeat protein
MNFFQQFKQRINKNPTHHPGPETNALREALDAGQRAKRSEDYPRALTALETAMSLAHKAHDSMAVAVIALNQAEVYIRQKRWTDANTLLEKTYQNAQETGQKTQMAYLLNGQGMLAQAQGQWNEAQEYYEQALDTARSTNAVGAEGRALGLLADVYLHNSNASYAAYLLREALPKLNLTGDIELSSAFVGRLGEALIASGHEDEGKQLLERALRLARQMGYRTYERHWSIILGKQAVEEGLYNQAYSHLVHVLSLSNLNEPSQETAQVLCLLSKICLRLRENKEALEHARHAVQVSESVNDPALLAQAKGALGMALLAEKQAAEAIPYLEAAATEYVKGNQHDHFGDNAILRSLAAAQVENGHFEQSIQTYQQAAQHAEANGNPLELASARRDLGLLYAHHYKMADAIREWVAAVTIYEAETQPAQVARLLCDIGAARRFLGQGQRAIRDFEQALMTLNTLNDDWETRGLVLSNAANTYVDQGDIESAESFFNEAIAIAHRLNNPAAETTRRGNYGWFLLSTGMPQQAISTLEYTLRQSKSLRLDLQTAIQTDNLGLAYDALGNYGRALEYHRQALEIIRPLNNPHWEHIFQINLAHSLLMLGEMTEPEPLFKGALAQGRATGDVELIIRALTGLAIIAIRGGRPEEATGDLEEAVHLARKADMRRWLAEALQVYSEQQAALQQPERSATLWEEARKLFQMLHSPEARVHPAWLNGKTVEPG